MRYMIISASGGILGDSFSCDKLEVAIAKGKALWKEATGFESMHEYQGRSVEEVKKWEEGYDEKIGAVSRFYEAHWWNEDEDVWVIQPEVIT